MLILLPDDKERERIMKRTIVFLWGLIGFILLSGSFSYSNNIDELNAMIQGKGAKWVARETPLSRIPKEEMVKWTGAREDLDLSGMAVDRSFYTPLSVPSSFDWTHHYGNFVTPIKNQHSPNRCGSCFVFASVAALESKILITYDMPWVDLDLSEQIVLSCSGAGNCEFGGSVFAVLNFLKNSGTYLERCYSYTATDGDCSKACVNLQTNAYRIDGWTLVVNGQNGPADLSAIKNALYTNGPVVAYMKVYEDFSHYGGGVYSYTSGDYTGSDHVVLIVGWDDSKGALKCKNSWGTAWGEEGFFWISYNELYGTGKTEFGKFVEALGNVLQTPVAVGPDLSGQWTSLTQTCKTSSKKQKRCNITGTLQISNFGDQSAPSSSVEVYFSDGEDYLKRMSVGKLKVGGHKTLKIKYKLPPGQTASGKDVIAVIDPGDLLLETNEKNNVLIYGPIP